ncbi:MAG TPA: MASE3 domain-containing protein [Anaerolineaceae bacterium]|nr:MASE3 domain-containing protein [Anaerolineaceae bacterium]
MDPEPRANQLLSRFGQAVIAGLALFGLYALSRADFPLFHTLVELFFIIIAVSIFIVTWNARPFLDNPALLFIGIAYLFVAMLDLLHVLEYQEVRAISGFNLNQAMQAWLAARLFLAGALVAASFFTHQRFNPKVLMAVFTALALLITVGIFSGKGIPAVYSMSFEPTPFKFGLEIVITVLFLAALGLLARFSADFHPSVFRFLGLSIASLAAAEITLSATLETFTPVTVTGHLISIAAVLLIYKAVTETGLVRPYELLFHNLQRSQDELRHERDFAAAILDNTYALVAVLDSQARILRLNRAFEESTGYSQAALAGKTLWDTDLFGGQAPALRTLLEEHLPRHELIHFEGYLTTQSERKIHVAWDAALRKNAGGDTEYIILTGMDITDRKQAEDELRFLSSHDTLTGLYNRAYFEQEMVRLAETDQFPASIVIADVDGLKAVNDAYGHLTGDKLLQRAAHILRSAFRTEDVIARMGGDEFAILLADADEAVAAHAQRRVHAILEAYNQVNPEFQISLSLGTATAIAGYMLMETYKHADQNMYQEKQQHKSQGHSPQESPG